MADSPATVLGRALPGDRVQVRLVTRDGERIAGIDSPTSIELEETGNDVRHLLLYFRLVGTDQRLVTNRDLDDGRVSVLLLHPRIPVLRDAPRTVVVESATPEALCG